MDSIYDAIGGLPVLEVAVQRFCERLRADKEVAHFFVWVDLHQQKSNLIAYLGQSIGAATGNSDATMLRPHTHMRIEQRHLEVVADHLAGTLQEIRIADALVGAIMDRMWPLVAQIITTGAVRAATA